MNRKFMIKDFEDHIPEHIRQSPFFIYRNLLLQINLEI